MRAINVAMILCLQSTYIRARVRAPGRDSFTPVSTFKLCSQQKACISYTSLHNAYIRTYRLVMRIVLSFLHTISPYTHCFFLSVTRISPLAFSPQVWDSHDSQHSRTPLNTVKPWPHPVWRALFTVSGQLTRAQGTYVY